MKIVFNQLIILLISLVLMYSCNSDTAHAHKHIIPQVNYDSKLDSLHIELPEITPPVANYVHITQGGKTLYLAGKGPRMKDGKNMVGKVGADLTVEEGYQGARRIGEIQLAVLKDYLGDLNKVKQVLKVTGMVNCTSDFENQPEVVNGFSDLMVEVFGDRGRHARAAVGMGSLPRNIAVEIDMIVEIY